MPNIQRLVTPLGSTGQVQINTSGSFGVGNYPLFVDPIDGAVTSRNNILDDSSGNVTLIGTLIGTTATFNGLLELYPTARSTNSRLIYLKQHDNDFGYSINMDDQTTGDLFLKGVNNGVESTIASFYREDLSSQFFGNLSGPLISSATASTGTMSIGGGVSNGETITFDDGNGHVIIFTYQDTPISLNDFNFTEFNEPSTFFVDIFNTSGINITAAYDGNVTVTFTNQRLGPQGNTTVTNNLTGITMTDMTGGANAVYAWQVNQDGSAIFADGGVSIDANTSNMAIGHNLYVGNDLTVNGGLVDFLSDSSHHVVVSASSFTSGDFYLSLGWSSDVAQIYAVQSGVGVSLDVSLNSGTLDMGNGVITNLNAISGFSDTSIDVSSDLVQFNGNWHLNTDGSASFAAGNTAIDSSGNLSLISGNDIRFNGSSDTNWRMGLGINTLTTSLVGAATSIQLIVGAGDVGPDGFAIGNTNGQSILELDGNTLAAQFNGNLEAFGQVSVGNGSGGTLTLGSSAAGDGGTINIGDGQIQKAFGSAAVISLGGTVIFSSDLVGANVLHEGGGAFKSYGGGPTFLYNDQTAEPTVIGASSTAATGKIVSIELPLICQGTTNLYPPITITDTGGTWLAGTYKYAGQAGGQPSWAGNANNGDSITVVYNTFITSWVLTDYTAGAVWTNATLTGSYVANDHNASIAPDNPSVSLGTAITAYGDATFKGVASFAEGIATIDSGGNIAGATISGLYEVTAPELTAGSNIDITSTQIGISNNVPILFSGNNSRAPYDTFDTRLYRTAAHTLTLDDGAGGAANLEVLGGLGVGGQINGPTGAGLTISTVGDQNLTLNANGHSIVLQSQLYMESGIALNSHPFIPDAGSELSSDGTGNLTLDCASLSISGLIFPEQATTVSAPSYVKGAIYFDTTLNKLRVGGASGWETVTSI